MDTSNAMDEEDFSRARSVSQVSAMNSGLQNAIEYFKTAPVEDIDETYVSQWTVTVIRIFKLFVYAISFCCVLGGSIVSKITLLLMTSQLQIPDNGPRFNRTRPVCAAQKGNTISDDFVVPTNHLQAIGYSWALVLAIFIPDFLAFLRSFRICLFKTYKLPSFSTAVVVLVTEIVGCISMALFVFALLPELDVFRGAMLTNCIFLFPAILNLLNFNASRRQLKGVVVNALDYVAVISQCSGIVVWPLVINDWYGWCIPIALIGCSLTWWENYVDETSESFKIIRWLAECKKNLRQCRSFLYLFVPWLKTIVVIFIMVSVYSFRYKRPIGEVFTLYGESFAEFNVDVFLLSMGTKEEISTRYFEYTPLIVSGVHIFTAYITYRTAIFTCQICVQLFSFALPICLAIPATLTVLFRLSDPTKCYLQSTFGLPVYTAFNTPLDSGVSFWDFMTHSVAWIWIFWLFSQFWITNHIWQPMAQRMAKANCLFVSLNYNSTFVDQALAANKRRYINCSDIEDIPPPPIPPSIRRNDSVAGLSIDPSEMLDIDRKPDGITRIFTCATMWHETEHEMIQLLKSLFRLDQHQCTCQFAQEITGINDPDFYAIEAHIFFDDAFETRKGVRQVNEYVKLLVQCVDIAASNVRGKEIHLEPPTKYRTPYGGRLEWIMPGRNKLIAHLKDKDKIRHRKRWSQCMYMYYLLGHRLIALDLEDDQKELRAKNTFILALDGDVNFQPEAVKLLVDLMKKDDVLGAACGRIHPVGSGPMIWYQKFEYAIGHWLQKATEHMIGCVLCSPGCFSLFRAKALMDLNVMRTYTTESKEPLHYVQYDQGEDRWLCTLLLQRGYRVEYSAASDAYTQAPEQFEEFYTQRRRWAPSTMANIMDLLLSAKQTVKANINISMLYIAYQFMLMVGSIIGPGNIFLMLVGAVNAVFKISMINSLIFNLIPVLIFIVICFYCNNRIQVLVAEILTGGYALLMMAVLVSVLLQIQEEGIFSPSGMFMIALSGSMVITAMFHPREASCIGHGLLYFLFVPSMYLILMLYSVTNLNVVVWGTREKPKTQEDEPEQTVVAPKPSEPGLLASTLQNLGFRNEVSHQDSETSCSFGSLFSCMCCPHPKDQTKDKILSSIVVKLDQLEAKIDTAAKRRPSVLRKPSFSRPTVSFGDTQILESPSSLPSFSSTNYDNNNAETSVIYDHHSENVEINDLPPPPDDQLQADESWLMDTDLGNGTVEVLHPNEEAFWKQLIVRFLYPLIEDANRKKQIADELIQLRNKVSAAFLMINALFILSVFLLQLHKDQIHIKWNVGSTQNATGDGYEDKIILQEPLGFFFIVFFAIVLVIQFTGMLMHRLETIKHILASTEIFPSRARQEDAEAERLRQTRQYIQASVSVKRKSVSVPLPPNKRQTIYHETALDVNPIYLDQQMEQKLFANNQNNVIKTELPEDTMEGIRRRFSVSLSTFSQGQRSNRVSFNNVTSQHRI